MAIQINFSRPKYAHPTGSKCVGRTSDPFGYVCDAEYAGITGYGVYHPEDINEPESIGIKRAMASAKADLLKRMEQYDNGEMDNQA